MIDEEKAKEMGISFVLKPIVMIEIAKIIWEVLDKKWAKRLLRMIERYSKN